MSKSDFRMLKGKTVTLQIVNYGEDCKVKMVGYGEDARFKKVSFGSSSESIKCKIVTYG